MANAFDPLLLGYNPRFYYECADLYQSATATDSGSHAAPGTIFGSTPTTLYSQPGPIPATSAFKFDGNTDYIVASASAVPVTWAGGWFKFTTLGNSPFMICSNYQGAPSGFNLSYALSLNSNNTIEWFTQTNASVNIGVLASTTVVQLGRWYFLMGTYDGTNWNLYVNGVLDTATASGTGPGGGQVDSSGIAIGAFYQTSGSTVANTAAYISRVFVGGGTPPTASQVRALYQAAVGLITPNTIPLILGE